jgi:hypothetical protein
MTWIARHEQVTPVAVDRLEHDADGARWAVLDTCPICGEAGHRHLMPADLLPTADLVRVPRCRADRGLVRLVMPAGVGL